MPQLHAVLRAKREMLGLSANRVVDILSLTPMSYFDLEERADEWDAVVPFYALRFLCRWFEVDLLSFVEETSGFVFSKDVQPHIAIRKRREALGYSYDTFADKCGFYPVFTSLVEADEGIILYPFRVSRVVARP